MKMIQITPETAKDFARLAQGKRYGSTSELLAAFHEWVRETYGPRAVTINGREYPPDTTTTRPFPESVYFEGETPSQRRYVKIYGKTDLFYAAIKGEPASSDDPAEHEILQKIIAEQSEKVA